jgi:hypothetical protein
MFRSVPERGVCRGIHMFFSFSVLVYGVIGRSYCLICTVKFKRCLVFSVRLLRSLGKTRKRSVPELGKRGSEHYPKTPSNTGQKVNILNISPLEQFSNPFLYLPIPLINLGISKITFYGILIVIVTLAFYTFPFVVNSSIIGTR